jgi:hypothetical protein
MRATREQGGAQREQEGAAGSSGGALYGGIGAQQVGA